MTLGVHGSNHKEAHLFPNMFVGDLFFEKMFSSVLTLVVRTAFRSDHVCIHVPVFHLSTTTAFRDTVRFVPKVVLMS